MAMVAILNSGYNTVQTCQILFYSNTGLDSIVVYTELPSGSATKTSLDCGWSKSHDCATLFSGNSQVQTQSHSQWKEQRCSPTLNEQRK